MHWASLAVAIISTPFGLGFDHQQIPLSSINHAGSSTSPSSDAPSYRDDLLRLHKSLVAISSVSGEENEIGQFLVDYLEQNRYQVDIQFVPPSKDKPNAPERFNVLAWRGDRKPAYKALITSHIDVVPPHIEYEIAEGPVTKDTIIKGRGSVDAKGSVASQIFAVNQLLNTNEDLVNDLLLLFVVGEETTGDGMKFFSNSIKDMHPPISFKSAIFGEPTENKLACGHKGGLFCNIWAKGKAGHSGYPEIAKSANELMIKAMSKVYAADFGASTVFGNTTVNVGRFEGGAASNVIAADAYVGFAARVAIGAERTGHEDVQKKLQAILDETDKDAFTLECTHGYGPYECNCNVDGFSTIVVNYGTDIPNLDGDYVRYLYGPGSILVAHGADESLTVGDLETAVEDYQKLILHSLKQ